MSLKDDRLILAVPMLGEGLGVEVQPTGRPRSNERDYLCVADAHGARLLLPVEPRQGLACSPVLGGLAPSLGHALRWQFFRTVYRFGGLALFPKTQRIRMRGLDRVDWNALGYQGGSAPVPVFLRGTPNRSQKMITFFVEPKSRQVQCIGKFPMGPVAAEKIAKEFRVLERLRTMGIDQTPEPLVWLPHAGAATQSAMAGQARMGPVATEHARFLERLVKPGEGVTVGELKPTLTSSDGRNDAHLERAFDTLCAAYGRPRVPAAVSHGDFTPWNLVYSPDGTLGVVDWEDADDKGFGGEDILHYWLRVRLVFENATGKDIFEQVRKRKAVFRRLEAVAREFGYAIEEVPFLLGLHALRKITFHRRYQLPNRRAQKAMEEFVKLASAWVAR